MTAKSVRWAMCEVAPSTPAFDAAASDDAYRTLAEEIRANARRLGAEALRAMLAEAFCRRQVASDDPTAGVAELIAALRAELGEHRLAAAAALVSAEQREAIQEEEALTGAAAACAVPLRRRLLEALRRRPLSATEMAIPLECPAGMVDQLVRKMSDEWLVLPFDDPRQGERIYVLSLQGARWIDRHSAYGRRPGRAEGVATDVRAATTSHQELPIAGHPLALICQADRWSVVPSYFAAVSAHLPPDTVESRATMAFAAWTWCNRHGFHRRGFIMRSVAECALAGALAEDPPQWAAQARGVSAEHRWPPDESE